MSRVRSYLLTNSVCYVPEQYLPLLIHAIALFDAHQVFFLLLWFIISYFILKPKLHSFFRAWKVLWEKGRQLDTFYYHSTLSKAMNRWQHNIRAQKIVRMSGLRILYKRNKVLLKNVWQTWKT